MQEGAPLHVMWENLSPEVTHNRTRPEDLNPRTVNEIASGPDGKSNPDHPEPARRVPPVRIPLRRCARRSSRRDVHLIGRPLPARVSY